MSASPFDTLAGSLRVSPGVPVPDSLSSSRQDWAAKLGEGRLVETLPGLMASVFNLCSHAHRLCSQLAIEVAAPGLLPAPREVDERLRLETAQEHVRRIGLDWPALLGAAASDRQATVAQAAAAAMRGCPLLAHSAADRWADAARWLHQCLLDMPPRDWLAAWEAGGADWLRTWSDQHGADGDGVHWLVALVRDASDADTGASVGVGAALRVHTQPEQLHALDEALASTPGFALFPQWQGACAHTGSWTRLHAHNPPGALTPWGLLGSRLAELVRLCLQADDGLAWGCLSTGPRRGLAWVEMARGLLVHQVALDDACARVRSCRVLAPTQWNFHPRGEVAQRVSRLDARSPNVDRQLRLLMAAFDPCVPFERIPLPVMIQESTHA